jgi:hypothetical protein
MKSFRLIMMKYRPIQQYKILFQQNFIKGKKIFDFLDRPRLLADTVDVDVDGDMDTDTDTITDTGIDVDKDIDIDIGFGIIPYRKLLRNNAEFCKIYLFKTPTNSALFHTNSYRSSEIRK